MTRRELPSSFVGRRREQRQLDRTARWSFTLGISTSEWIPTARCRDPRRRREKAAELKKKFQTVNKSVEFNNSSLLLDMAEIGVTLSSSAPSGRDSFEKSL